MALEIALHLGFVTLLAGVLIRLVLRVFDGRASSAALFIVSVMCVFSRRSSISLTLGIRSVVDILESLSVMLLMAFMQLVRLLLGAILVCGFQILWRRCA